MQSLDPAGLIRSCKSCGADNRIPFDKADKTGKCGRCKERLPPAGVPYAAADEKVFARAIASSPLPWLVTFGNGWSRVSVAQRSHTERAAAELAGEAVCCVVDIDEAPAIAARYAVTTVPTVIAFRDGEAGRRHFGPLDASKHRGLLTPDT